MKFFPFPKPVDLLRHLLTIGSDRDSIILDFFSGSATSAHAVMQLNAEDGGDRKHIQVQLPEPTTEDDESYQAGYKTISAIARERIRRASSQIEVVCRKDIDERPMRIDLGFRAFRLIDTNFAKWRVASQVDRNELEQHLFNLRESASDDARPDDLLTEVLLKQGYSLSERIESIEMSGVDCRVVGENLVIAYLDEKIKPTLEQLREMVEQAPARIIVLEDCFQGDDELKTNLAQLCKSKGIELWTA